MPKQWSRGGGRGRGFVRVVGRGPGKITETRQTSRKRGKDKQPATVDAMPSSAWEQPPPVTSQGVRFKQSSRTAASSAKKSQTGREPAEDGDRVKFSIVTDEKDGAGRDIARLPCSMRPETLIRQVKKSYCKKTGLVLEKMEFKLVDLNQNNNCLLLDENFVSGLEGATVNVVTKKNAQDEDLDEIIYLRSAKTSDNLVQATLPPLRCHFCELGQSRMSKADPAEAFHLQLEINGQLGKGNPSNRETENLSRYLRVDAGIADQVLQHIGVSYKTKIAKNKLSFIRRLCWDNMVSLKDLCISFEQVWRFVSMMKDVLNISQEVLAQTYRWKFLFPQDSYYNTYLRRIFRHIHQGQDGVYSFTRNEVVEIE